MDISRNEEKAHGTVVRSLRESIVESEVPQTEELRELIG